VVVHVIAGGTTKAANPPLLNVAELLNVSNQGFPALCPLVTPRSLDEI